MGRATPLSSPIRQRFPTDIPPPRTSFTGQEILSILERNLMSEELPYLDAIVLETPVKALAAELGAKRSTVWWRMNRVRKKAQAIIAALERGDSS
jgi:hypothetical protein